MNTSYDRIAGQSVERLAALSDGIFGVAMTLLVLDLRVPAAEVVHNEYGLWRALVAISPQLIMYMMSFITLGIMWVWQQTQLNHLARSRISHRASRLLEQHPASWRGSVLQLGLRDQKAPGEGRYTCGSAGSDLPPHRDCPVALRIRRFALRIQYVLEHSVHRSRATQLCHRTTDLAAFLIEPSASRPPHCVFRRPATALITQ